MLSYNPRSGLYSQKKTVANEPDMLFLIFDDGKS